LRQVADSALVAQLLHRVGSELAGLAVAGVREHQMIEHLHDPAIVAAGEVLAGPGDHRIGTAHVLDVLASGRLRRERCQGRGIAVVAAAGSGCRSP
jgi:hypothetical protein